MFMRTPMLLSMVLLAGCSTVVPPVSPGLFQPDSAVPIKIDADAKAQAITKGIAVLLKLQQGNDNAEWPYEGVYRVHGKIPWGYRVGGTAICALALVEAPGYGEDADRQAAVHRALKFICGSRGEEDLLVTTYDGEYDVRSWGHIEAVGAIARMKQLDAIPQDLREDVEAAMVFYLDAVHTLETPKNGGWNYSRPPGKDTPAPPSSFMTSRGAQALFEAAQAGYAVDAGTIARALDFLEGTHTASGAVVYSGSASPKRPDRESDAVPGAVGRMCATEATLLLAGRGSAAAARASVDAFIVHWGWLNQRRAKTGTHIKPYMVAPYYFMFAHYYAAEAVEMLPKSERGEYRRRINELLFSVRQEDGSWNDRVFERSGAYGTAMAMMAIMAPDRRPPARIAPENKAAPE